MFSLVLAAAAVATATPPPTPPPLPRPPQYVVMSFDGAGLVDLFEEWRSVARDAHAHFTFFLSGVFLLEPQFKKAYLPPDRLAGHSAIGFLRVPTGAQPESTLRGLLAEVEAARAEGHEIGTHFNGHWCGEEGIGAWDAEDWREEIDSFRMLLRDVNRNNALSPPVTMTLGSASIVGARTPCLEGDRRELDAALASAGFRYDASRPGTPGEWPRREHGIWSYPVPPIKFPGTSHRLLATDYNLYEHESRATDVGVDAEDAAGFEKDAYSALVTAFEESYYGGRAPFTPSSHFERWSHGAYLRALRRFLRETCLRPEVQCDSFEEVTDWLDDMPATDLERLRRGEFEKLARPIVAVRRTKQP